MIPLVFFFTNSLYQAMAVSKLPSFRAILVCTDLSLILVYWKPKPTSCDIFCVYFTVAMAPVVRIEPNGFQALLSHDDTIDDLKAHGWDIFLRKFEGYNLAVTQAFAQKFDGFRAKVRDVQLEVTKCFMARATRLPQEGEKWFKNAKMEDVPWSLFMVSRMSTCYPKGIPIAFLKPRWHNLILILKQFFTCEGRYGLVFLYHILLLMLFIGFELNMSFYLLMSLYKMSKHFKRQSMNSLSSLFHHRLIKILLISHLSQIRDNWESFLSRNGFSQADNTVNPPLNVNPNLDSPVTDSQVFNSLGGCEFNESVSIVLETPMVKELPCMFSPRKYLEQVVGELKEKYSPVPANEPNQNHNDKLIKRKIHKGKKQQSSDSNFRNKRSGRLISRSLRNHKKDHLSSILTIEVNDQCSDQEINDFLAQEDPDNQCPRNETNAQVEQYDFVSRFPPCLKGQEGFNGISHDLSQATGKHKIPIADFIPHRSAIAPVHCDSCLDWIERYYRDIPLLQAQVKHLAACNYLLEQENQELKAHTERENKRPKRADNIIIKNTTNFKAIINS
jgi:hypothetical protein